MKYVLDVGIYTRRIRARILYNHLYVFQIPKPYIRALLRGKVLAKIVDHPNYNPRIIEWMTDLLNVQNLHAREYAKAFLSSLDNPARIWDTAFRSHIPTKCQNLLFALFFCSEYGAEIDDLKVAFEPLHLAMCKRYGQGHAPKDFAESLKILEGSFIKISNGRVSFINPSVRDYLTEYLSDTSLLSQLAPTAQTAKWARELWTHYQNLEAGTSDDTAKFVRRFAKVAERFRGLRIWKRYRDGDMKLHDESNTGRLELLLDWWDLTKLPEFASAAKAIAKNPIEGFSYWLDGDGLVDLVKSLDSRPRNKFPDVGSFRKHLENGIISLLDYGMSPDEILAISDSVDEARNCFSLAVTNAINRAINRSIDEVEVTSAGVHSQSVLDDHLKSLRALARRAQIETSRVQQAVKAIQTRKEQIEEQVEEEDEPYLLGESPRREDKFDDTQLRELFTPLVR
jgi:hypothetical protein